MDMMEDTLQKQKDKQTERQSKLGHVGEPVKKIVETK